jgi:hypothetical protein
MPRPEPTLPAALRRAPFTVAAARELGLDVDHLRRAGARIPTAGVRSTAPSPERHDVRARCAELVPALPADAVFCHATALALLGVDLPLGLDLAGPLHVQVGPGTSWPRRAGVVGHRRATAEVQAFTLPHDIRVLLPELAWLQLAPVLEPRELVVAADALMRRRTALCRPDQLSSAVAALPPGARGVRRLRSAIERARPGTDSCMETRLRWVLVEDGLPCPVVNQLVRAPDGTVVAMPDLSYPAERVAIEYDGDIHRTDRAVWRRDIMRRQHLESLGWRVVTCTADDVLRHPDRPPTWVRRALARGRSDAPR